MQIIPIEIPAICKFMYQTGGVESVPSLPQLKNHQTPNKTAVEGTHRKHAEIVDVAGFVTLIPRADFLRENFRQCQTDEFGRDERQESEITLLDLSAPSVASAFRAG